MRKSENRFATVLKNTSDRKTDLDTTIAALRAGLLPATGQLLPELLGDLSAVEEQFFAEEQRRFVWLMILIATVPLIAVYLTGFGIAWVRRGFKGD